MFDFNKQKNWEEFIDRNRQWTMVSSGYPFDRVFEPLVCQHQMSLSYEKIYILRMV
jgi:hypothetical protein